MWKGTSSIIKVVEDNGQCKILMSKAAQQSSSPDARIACQLVKIAQGLMNPATSSKLKQLMNNAGAINQLKSMFGF